jgi:hypothetical protein
MPLFRHSMEDVEFKWCDDDAHTFWTLLQPKHLPYVIGSVLTPLSRYRDDLWTVEWISRVTKLLTRGWGKTEVLQELKRVTPKNDRILLLEQAMG